MFRIVAHMATLTDPHRPSQTLTDPLPFRQTVKNPWTLFGLGTAVNRFTRLHTTSPVTGGHTYPAEIWRGLADRTCLASRPPSDSTTSRFTTAPWPSEPHSCPSHQRSRAQRQLPLFRIHDFRPAVRSHRQHAAGIGRLSARVPNLFEPAVNGLLHMQSAKTAAARPLACNDQR
ncbi:hypothetical protein HBI04_057650 [Parastagonospora nodorum]|nr:hypothetical protein HBH47_117140 [Parastagonospora nodorum]KAH4208730.1 hypothetical protein HBI95_094440 [Parastagonospora nodorum]KAH4269455.1 hypothetical protein HBI03_050000 [Parastagonospora nodorum]KAH4280215.1 hypothetical protein HBI04_057650 [Parastagonospora nodorum]KAH4602280.1 hypothetical protein HBH82_164120 [Parastagonospora nodorum]